MFTRRIPKDSQHILARADTFLHPPQNVVIHCTRSTVWRIQFYYTRQHACLQRVCALTVGVSRKWAGVDNVWEQEKPEARKMPVNRADSYMSGARFVRRRVDVPEILFALQFYFMAFGMVLVVIYGTSFNYLYSTGYSIFRSDSFAESSGTSA